MCLMMFFIPSTWWCLEALSAVLMESQQGRQQVHG